jgi:tetratricopeptide (TPR) repeat protein
LLEIIIIVCLALALFLLLRHYPDANTLASFFGSNKFRKFISEFKFHRKKADNLSSVEAEIQKNNQFVAPSEVEAAISQFKVGDPEVARILHLSSEAFAANDLREAEDKALEAIGKEKKCAEAYVIIGKIAFSRGQFSDAKEAFKTALKCDKELGEAYYGLGKIELNDDNLSEAIDNLQKAIILEKGNADWYADLGRAYMQVRQYSKAAKALKRATSLDIDNKEYKDLASEAEEKQKTHSMYSRYK